MSSALPCLHDLDLLEAVKCTPLPSTVIGSFYGTMSVSDFLLPIWIPASFLRFGFHTLFRETSGPRLFRII